MLPPLSPLKLEAQLAFLLLHRQHPVTRDQLAECLWPEDAKAEAHANLRRHLHLLRRALPGNEWILTDHETVQWNPAADYSLDVETFMRCAAQGAYEQCLELYQGDLLPELYDDWLLSEREKLFGLFLQSLQSAADHYAGQGEYATALHYARLLLTHDPLHEEIHRMVMRLSCLSGDRQAALHQFEECRELLRRELDVEPMPATTELYQAILTGHPVAFSAGRKEPACPPDKESPTAEQAGSPAPIAVTPPAPLWRRGWLAAWAGVVLIIVAVLLLRRPNPHSSLVISGPASMRDTWITEAFPNDLYWPDDPDRTPHHRYTRAHLQYFDQRAFDRILVEFDLNKLPVNARIEAATLDIHLEAWVTLEGEETITNSFPASVSVFKILRPWQPEQATFNEALAGQPWAQPGLAPGLDFDPSPLDVQPINDTTWLTFDIQQAVREWQRHPDKNYGVLLFITAAPEGLAHYWVDMTDAAAPNLRPAVRITYR